jgi:hypothetical protein
MHESAPYRAELASYAASFAARERRQRWSVDSLSKAERMLFVGFFFVRKLIECRRVTDTCARSRTKIHRASISRKREVSLFQPHDLLKDVETASFSEHVVGVEQLADTVVHTWWIIPAQNESKGLKGFVLTTDRHRNSELWLVPTHSIVEIFLRFASSRISELEVHRDSIGRLTYWRAA